MKATVHHPEGRKATVVLARKSRRKPSTLTAGYVAAPAGEGPNDSAAIVQHEGILRGLSFRSLVNVAGRLGIAPEAMARTLGVSRATFHRRMKQPKQLLSPLESDALARYESLHAKAVDTFDGDDAAARQWLSTRQPGLGRAIPLELARTTVGFREVEKLLTRIDLGVYA